MSVLSHEHAQNACYWRFANWATIVIDATASAQLEQNRECPSGTSAILSRCSTRHTSHTSLDAATAVTVKVAMAGGVELTTGSWLVTSISVPVAVVFGRHMESLGVSTRYCGFQKLQPAVLAVVVSLNARLDPHVILNVAFLFRPPNLNTTPDPVCVGHAVDRNIPQLRHKDVDIRIRDLYATTQAGTVTVEDVV